MASTVAKPNSNDLTENDETLEKGSKLVPVKTMTSATNAGGRKTLKVLQEKAGKNPSNAQSQTKATSSNLIGREAGFDKYFAPEKSKKTGEKGFKIYQDSQTESSTSSSSKVLKTCHTQTKLTGKDLFDLQAAVTPDAEYYKELAEKRREALNESLKENEELWIENQEQSQKLEEQSQQLEEQSQQLEEKSQRLEEQSQKNAYLEEKVVSLEETVEKARKITEMIGPYLDEEAEPEQEEAKDETEIKEEDNATV